MFNIVKHRDFMLADLPTWRETEEMRPQNYGHEYLVISTARGARSE